MFGFLRPPRFNKSYRQAYSRCCAMQHLIRGTTSLPFLSYEAVFLYQLAVDLGINPGPPIGTKTCCRLRKRRQDLSAADADFSSFAASFGLVLASIKLADDVRDEQSVIAKLAQWKLKKPIRASFDFFRNLQPPT